MTNSTKGKLIKGSAIAIDVGVPLGATFAHFPLWVHRGTDSTVSGIFLIFALLCCIPFFRQIKEMAKNPSAPMVWTVLCVLFLLLRSIIDDLIWVCFFGMISNYVGTAIYKVGDFVQNKEKTT